jgi:hypothetical protein
MDITLKGTGARADGRTMEGARSASRPDAVDGPQSDSHSGAPLSFGWRVLTLGGSAFCYGIWASVFALLVSRTRAVEVAFIPQSPLPGAREWTVALLVLLGWQHAAVFLHEMGHVIAAQASGFTIRSVSIGTGPLVVRMHVGRALVTVNAVPGGGCTKLVPQPGRRPTFWMPAGGPVADLVSWLVSVAGAVLTLRTDIAGRSSLILGELSFLVAIHQSARLLNHLVPRTTFGHPNDGQLMFPTLAGGRAGSARPAPGQLWADAVEASAAGRPEAAVAMSQVMVRRYGVTSSHHGVAVRAEAFHLIRAGRFTEAMTHIDALIARADDAAERAGLRAARADVLLSQSVVEGVPLAEELREELARDIDPAAGPELRHTHALLLLARGDDHAAAGQAQVALRDARGLAAPERASVAATITIALARTGDLAQAQRWYDEVPIWSPWRDAAARSLGLAD